MLLLTKLFSYNNRLAFYWFLVPRLTTVKCLVWYKFIINIKKDYIAIINFYISFYRIYNEKTWLTQITILEK